MYNSAYDTWQLANILELNCLLPKCSEEQMKLLEYYGQVKSCMEVDVCLYIVMTA